MMKKAALSAWMRRGGNVVPVVLIATLATLALPCVAAAQRTGAALVAALDSAARAHVASPLVPGASVAVVHRGETLLERGYGYVDLEWDVPTPEDGRASYQIGSITKQFTAAAAMLLVEEGKLDLEADFTDYVDFDTGGRTIPVRRLLDHTSGIKGYTEVEAFGEFSMLHRPREELLREMEKHPFDFEPGTAQIYNNTAYFLLGLVIEAVSGQSYEDFVAERLFEPVGMTDSYYCSETAIRARRAHGYDAVDPGELIRARYLDHTWPYAAGSLCSTAADLVRWNQALHQGDLLTTGSYQVMTVPEPLEDGTLIRYAGGLQVDDSRGRRVISHGGGINGFLSDGRYYPDDDLIVIVLQNGAGPVGPASLSSALVDLVLGPAPELVAVDFAGDLTDLEGTYTGPARGRPMTVTVSSEDGALRLRVGASAQAMTPIHRGGLRWQSGATIIQFVREGGSITALRFDTGGGHYVLEREGG